MRFNASQYDQSIEDLTLAKKQLTPDGNSCAICTDSGHMAFECGGNPLVAMAMCYDIAHASEDLHTILHRLSGFDQAFGVQLGPRRVIVPDAATTGVDLIFQERAEQLNKHSYSSNCDDKHAHGELAIEAAQLAAMETGAVVSSTRNGSCHDNWHLQEKLLGQRIHQLKVAGALIAAEIDRLIRSGVAIT